MTGSYKVELYDKKVKYEFTINRNITIIRGDSATGKSTLINFLDLASNHTGDASVKLICDVPCLAVNIGAWKLFLQNSHDSILFLDEDAILQSYEFAKEAINSDCYLVLITRSDLPMLPYSVDSIYELKNVAESNSVYKAYNTLVPIYNCNSICSPKTVLTEDSKSGYTFIKELLCKKEFNVLPARGNSNIPTMLDSLNGYTLAIVDGAAFGPYANKAFRVCDTKNSSIWFPESFEWLLLNSDIFDNYPFKDKLKDILSHPWDFIDSKVWASWERYFTAVLQTISTVCKEYTYSKKNLGKYYLQPEIVQSIVDTFPEEIRNCLGLTVKED